ncbi:MAG: DUF5610 domain-containing protein [Tolumonas sp.]|nr:DUF5610 domain-containing protein [Tolumonas sp.]MDD2841145.1 DUF5610 domain-containing protein [Tolumonas sp.]
MKLDQVNSAALQNMLKSTQRNMGKNAQATTQVSDEVSLSHSAKLGNRVLQFSLSQSLTINGKNYSVKTPDQADDESPESLFDFQKVADNVLSFVTNTINARKQAGDDNEALEKMLGQARKGIDQGFTDARKELDKSGTLTDPLSKGIDKSYDLIQKGLKDFEKDLFGQSTDGATGDNTATATDAAQTTDSAKNTKTPKEIGNSILAAFAGKQSASLELTTKEGDKITIQFDDQQQWRQQQNSGLAKKALQTYGELGGNAKKSDATNAKSDSSIFYSHTTQFSFKVEGDLNSSELKSISEMVNKVGSLSDSFFGGNITDALQQAQKLDLSDSELTSLSLDLYQKQAFGWQSNSGNDALRNASSDSSATTDSASSSVTTNNQSGLTNNQQAAAALPDVFSQLGDYLTQLQSMFDQMIASFNPDSHGNLQSWVARQQHPEKSDEQIGQFVSFNQRMQQAMASLADNQQTNTTDTTAV